MAVAKKPTQAKTKTSKPATLTINLNVIERCLNDSISSAKTLLIESGKILGVNVPEDAFSPYQGIPSEIDLHLKSLYNKDPARRDLIAAFSGSLPLALSNLLTLKKGLELENGIDAEKYFLCLCRGMRDFGFCEAVLRDGHLHEDATEIFGLGKIQAESKRKSDNAKGGKVRYQRSTQSQSLALINNEWLKIPEATRRNKKFNKSEWARSQIPVMKGEVTERTVISNIRKWN